MADKRKKNKGTSKNKGGNPGYGKLNYIREQVEQHSKLWWSEWKQMMDSKPDEFINDNVKTLIQELIKKGDGYTAKEIIKDLAKGAFYRKQFAMTEYNKIQCKMIPQDISGDLNGNFTIKWSEK
jgi:hypothetical protein